MPKLRALTDRQQSVRGHLTPRTWSQSHRSSERVFRAGGVFADVWFVQARVWRVVPRWSPRKAVSPDHDWPGKQRWAGRVQPTGCPSQAERSTARVGSHWYLFPPVQAERVRRVQSSAIRHQSSEFPACSYFQTSIEFRPALAAQHDHAAAHGQAGRQELFARLISQVDGNQAS
jgi:hypothetical protein